MQAVTAQKDCVNLVAIKPSRGPQFSPNLYAWMRKQQPSFREMIRVYSGKSDISLRNKTLYIGFIDDSGCFCGTRLYQVLCKGGRQESFAYAQTRKMDLHEVKGFWRRYEKIGRCAIDTKHTGYFIGDETRWKERGDRRECQWCGKHTQKRKRWIEKVQHEDWVSA